MAPNGTTFIYSKDPGGVPATDVLFVPLLVKPQPPLELIARVDKLCDAAVSELANMRALQDEVGHLAHTTRSRGCRRVLAVSLGTAEKLTAHEISRAAAKAARWLTAERLSSATLWIDGLTTTGVDDPVAAWATGMSLAGFKFAAFKEKDAKTPAKVRVFLRSSEPGHVAGALTQVRDAAVLADAVNYARQLAHQPGNVIQPASLATEARTFARRSKLKCTVLNANQLRQLRMNGLLSVGQGAQHPPCLIQLEYRGHARSRLLTVLVGKAITFDTGGYTLKPRDGMTGMKFDKCGGTTVMGVLKAAAALRLKCNIVGLVAVAENAISEKAYKIDDIIRMMSGKTVEVNNTDAEGRLVLADALWYAQKKLKPTALIDVATLTGGASIALGHVAAGLMANDDELAGALGEAGRKVHERLWRLPLWDDYRELLKSNEADLKNSAGKRDAHCIVGGMFLKEFVGPKMPWAHLDIANVAADENGSSPWGKGATGFGVRLLVEFLRRHGA